MKITLEIDPVKFFSIEEIAGVLPQITSNISSFLEARILHHTEGINMTENIKRYLNTGQKPRNWINTANLFIGFGRYEKLVVSDGS